MAALTCLSQAQFPQEARVAAGALHIEPAAGGGKIQVTLRLVDTPAITGAVAKVDTGGTNDSLPVSWTGFDQAPPAHCAWMIVIDSSNPARQRTVASCAEEVRSLLKLLPKGDAVMIASLARDLAVVAPFASSPAQLEAALARMKAEGDASFTTLIFQNVKHGLVDHLARRTETRQCVVLLTDGKDETPGGPVAAKARRDELITEARKLHIPVHTFGFAEKATEENYFADLKELSVQTDGLHVPAAVSTHQLPDFAWPTLVGVMHGGGTAVLDVSSLTQAVPVKLEFTSESGRTASVVILSETVEQMLHGGAPFPVVAVQSTSPPSVSGAPWMPVWGWGALGIGFLAVLVLAFRPSKTRPSVKDVSQQAQALHAVPVSGLRASVPVVENAPVPPACLELNDTKKSRHSVMPKGTKIGSGKHNDIVIKDDSVSENHCMILMKEGEWTIADLESANGVRVNGTYYHSASLSPNDLIQLGEARLRFLVES